MCIRNIHFIYSFVCIISSFYNFIYISVLIYQNLELNSILYYLGELLDAYNLMMSSGDGSGNGNFPGGGNNGDNPGGGGPQWQPYQYHSHIREDGRSYPTNNIPPSTVLQTYDPAGNIPPQNDREVGVLMQYRFNHNVRSLGYNNFTVSNTFNGDGIVDRMARERLLQHILGYRSRLPTAYRELDVYSDTPRWDRVRITSFLINSLYNSNR